MNTAAQQQTQRTVLDWLRVEYAIEKTSQKLAALTDLDSGAFVAEVKKLRGKKQPLTAAALAALRDEHTRSIAPARQHATEALYLEHPQRSHQPSLRPHARRSEAPVGHRAAEDAVLTCSGDESSPNQSP